MSREIARRWNARFREGYFPEPQARLTPTRRIMGLDGQAKMSKSLNNTIGLLEPPSAVWEKLRPAVTDPARKLRTYVGHPEVCNVFTLQKFFTLDQLNEIEFQCRSAKIACVACKKMLARPCWKIWPPSRNGADTTRPTPASRRAR